jgi:uncharacterized protein
MILGLLPAAAAGASLALVSSVHCAAMCGPIALATRVRGGAHASLAYYVGRLVTYTVLGALAGGFGRVLTLATWARWAEAALALTLAAALLHAGWALLRPARPRDPGLVTLRAKPRRSIAGAVLARVADDPLLLGAATALLPCGALLSALTASALLGGGGPGAVAMAVYASITGLAVVGVAQLGGLHTLGARLRRAVGIALVAGAIVVGLRPLAALHTGDATPACHAVAKAGDG